MSSINKKICPLMEEDGIYHFCEENECAWWNKKYCCCSIQSLVPTIPEDKEMREVVHSKVTEVWEGLTYYYGCSLCGTFAQEEWTYCPKCGAVLEWGQI